MSQLKYFIYPNHGEWARDTFSYSQAVRVGDRIECSGQGGWDPKVRGVAIPEDIDGEISQAFENVDLALRSAGGTGWPQVFRVNSYHANFTPEVLDKMGQQFREWMPEHKPIWVALPVERLGVPEMRIEIQVVAYSP
ncbi:hypothetical protein V2G26_007551 [Clonostachys chloroleuca]